MTALDVEEVRGPAGLAQLETTWTTLAHDAGIESFFLSHAWFRAVAAGISADVEIVVLVIRSGGSVVGLVPLLLQPFHWRIFPARFAMLMQNQDAPYSDLLAVPQLIEHVLRATFAHLQRRGGWHLWSATKINRLSATSMALAQILGAQSSLRAPAGSAPVLRLTGTWTDFWTARSQRFKKTVRSVANRIERLGTVTIRDEAVDATPDACMTTFRMVAERSWKSSLPISMTRNAGIARFFATLTDTLLATERLALWVLRLDGTAIATEYHVRDGRTVYALRSDFDDAHRASSPGAHLNAVIVRSYFDTDLEAYDMGPGDRDYKQRWATETTERDAFWLFHSAGYASALYAMERRALPPLRRVREWWRGPKETSLPLPAGED